MRTPDDMYNYKSAITHLDSLDYVIIDASEILNDVFVLLHNRNTLFNTASTIQWELVIGGWSGTKSVIRSGSGKGDYKNMVVENHTVAKFNEFKGKMKLKISDGLIKVTNDETNELIFFLSDSRITKWELTNLSVSAGKVRFINFNKLKLLLKLKQ